MAEGDLCKYLYICMSLQYLVFISNLLFYLLASFLSYSPNELQQLAGKEAKYDAYTYVTYPGSSGVAFGGVVCDPTQTERINFNSAYGPNDCNKYQPPKEIKCTKSNRIALTSEVYHVVKSIYR